MIKAWLYIGIGEEEPEPPVGEEWWMYFDFDPFTMTTEDNFLIIEVFS